jgi:hypothetical protein
MEHVAYRGAGGVVLEQVLRLALRDRVVRPDWPHEVDEVIDKVVAAVDDAGKLADRARRAPDAGADVDRGDIRDALLRVMAMALRAILETPLGK